MNIQIVSNSVNKVGGTNYINDFNMKLVEPIDAENTERYITPLSISYPLTTPNIHSKKSSFSVKFTFYNFRTIAKVATPANAGAGFANILLQNTRTLEFETDNVDIPSGVYTTDGILDYMNNHLEEYNILLEKLNNGKISIHIAHGVEYWFLQTESSFKNIAKAKASYTNSSFNFGALNYLQSGNAVLEANAGSLPIPETNGAMKVDIKLSDKLKFILGDFSELTDHYSNSTKSKDFTDLSSTTITSSYMADPSDGVNKMWVYCNEVQKSIVGNSKSSLLCVVPLNIKDQGSAELESYVPPSTPKKLNKSIIHSFNIQIKDNKGELIPFDSGSINIEARID